VDYLRRSSEQLAGLRADVMSLKQQLGPLGQEDAQLLRECSDGRRELVVLRAELRDIEAKTAAAESTLKGTLVRAMRLILLSLHHHYLFSTFIFSAVLVVTAFFFFVVSVSLNVSIIAAVTTIQSILKCCICSIRIESRILIVLQQPRRVNTIVVDFSIDEGTVKHQYPFH
jgi:hypothetical protein